MFEGHAKSHGWQSRRERVAPTRRDHDTERRARNWDRLVAQAEGRLGLAAAAENEPVEVGTKLSKVSRMGQSQD